MGMARAKIKLENPKRAKLKAIEADALVIQISPPAR